MGVHIADDAQHHISRGIEGPVTIIEQFRGNAPDGLGRAQNGDPDGMLPIHGPHHRFKKLTVRSILVHTDLLVDDAHFLGYAFLREIGGGHKFDEQPQCLLKIVGTGDIVGSHIIAGEGIGSGSQGRQFRRHIPVPRQIEHLMLQEMGNAGRGVNLPALQGKIRMDGAEIGYKISQFPGKTGPGHHADCQSVGQPLPIEHFPQFGVFKFGH